MKNNFYRKVRREGEHRSVVLTMGKIIPPDWRVVKLIVEKQDVSGEITVRIVKVA